MRKLQEQQDHYQSEAHVPVLRLPVMMQLVFEKLRVQHLNAMLLGLVFRKF